METITYHKAKIQIPKFLVDIWPYDLPLDAWPTFCGAGEGFGDKVIPDYRVGVCLSSLCFDHDIEWALSKKNLSAAIKANWNLRRNMRAILLANYDKSKHSRWRVEMVCINYFLGTSVGMLTCFEPDGTYEDPFSSPTVRSRLKKLAKVHDINPKYYE